MNMDASHRQFIYSRARNRHLYESYECVPCELHLATSGTVERRSGWVMKVSKGMA